MKRALMGGLQSAAMKVKSIALTCCIQQYPPSKDVWDTQTLYIAVQESEL